MSVSPERGLVVGAPYRLESILGEGGMAVVWAAVHTETDALRSLSTSTVCSSSAGVSSGQ